MCDANCYQYRNCRSEMRHYIPQNVARLLDVGCGAGDFGRAVQADRKIEVWGVELHQDAAIEA